MSSVEFALSVVSKTKLISCTAMPLSNSSLGGEWQGVGVGVGSGGVVHLQGWRPCLRGNLAQGKCGEFYTVGATLL